MREIAQMNRSHRVAISWLEVLLLAVLVLLGLASRQAVRSWAGTALKESRTGEFALQQAVGLPSLGRNLAQLQIELELVQKQVAQERSALLIARATAEVLESRHPGLLSAGEQVPEEVRETYYAVRDQEQMRKETVRRLVTRSGQLGKRIDRTLSTIRMAKKQTRERRELAAERQKRQRERVVALLTATTFLICVSLLLGSLEVARHLWRLQIRRFPFLLTAGLTLGLLLASQFLGASAVAFVALLLAFPLLLRCAA